MDVLGIGERRPAFARLVIALLTVVLGVAAAGCSNGNDRPDAAANTTTTTTEPATSTSAASPSGGDTTTTTADPADDGTDNGGTGAGNEGGGGSGGGGGGGGGGDDAAPPVGTGTGTVTPTSPVEADVPRDVSEALDGSCEDYADTAASLQQPGTSAEGTCTFGGEIINIYTFADGAAQREFVESGAFFDCNFIVAFGGGGATWYVAGDAWIARPGTEEVARDLASALDGDVASYRCEG